MTDLKLYVPVVTLSTQNDNKILELRTVFKRTIKWNKYRSEMTIQTKNHNLTYLIDPTFSKVKILFSNQWVVCCVFKISYFMHKIVRIFKVRHTFFHDRFKMII